MQALANNEGNRTRARSETKGTAPGWPPAATSECIPVITEAEEEAVQSNVWILNSLLIKLCKQHGSQFCTWKPSGATAKVDGQRNVDSEKDPFRPSRWYAGTTNTRQGGESSSKNHLYSTQFQCTGDLWFWHEKHYWKTLLGFWRAIIPSQESWPPPGMEWRSHGKFVCTSRALRLYIHIYLPLFYVIRLKRSGAWPSGGNVHPQQTHTAKLPPTTHCHSSSMPKYPPTSATDFIYYSLLRP